jgi:mannose-6-phosphate isomerase class I
MMVKGSPATNFEKRPFYPASNLSSDCFVGWDAIRGRIGAALREGARTVAVECYPGVCEPALAGELARLLPAGSVWRTAEAFRKVDELRTRLEPYLTGDPVFGRICDLELPEFFDSSRLRHMQSALNARPDPVILVGAGAALICPDAHLLIYADMPRWEIQQRQRRGGAVFLGEQAPSGDPPGLQYKRGFFVDWRVADRWKQRLLERADLLLDTTEAATPKLVTGDSFRSALGNLVRRPFRVVPLFDPGPWGGEWLRRVCGLPHEAPNYAWCFNCVPEENSLLLGYGDARVEVPALDLVLSHPRELLGKHVYERFGAEFPIRFDFLDTMGGGNLSLQVHPLTEYIRSRFGMAYTQDESYYILDAAPDATVYLGLQDHVDRTRMIADLEAAQQGGGPFNVERYVNRWRARRHDHFHIPAGTIHCAGRDCLVLEISATPYIFTFKLWDWGRLGMNGEPRPIHLQHGVRNLQWDRTTEWVRANLISRPQPAGAGDGFREERTGLCPSQFIETRRHWFTGATPHAGGETVNVLNLVEGEEITVESAGGRFDPLVIHYPETFIVPAMAGDCVIRPSGPSAGEECATVKAFVRSGT